MCETEISTRHCNNFSTIVGRKVTSYHQNHLSRISIVHMLQCSSYTMLSVKYIITMQCNACLHSNTSRQCQHAQTQQCSSMEMSMSIFSPCIFSIYYYRFGADVLTVHTQHQAHMKCIKKAMTTSKQETRKKKHERSASNCHSECEQDTDTLEMDPTNFHENLNDAQYRISSNLVMFPMFAPQEVVFSWFFSNTFFAIVFLPFSPLLFWCSQRMLEKSL